MVDLLFGFVVLASTRFLNRLNMPKTRGTRRDEAEPVYVVIKGTAVEVDGVWKVVIEVLPALKTVEFNVMVLRAGISDTTTEVVVVSETTGAVTAVIIAAVVVSLPGTTADKVLKIVVVEVEVV